MEDFLENNDVGDLVSSLMSTREITIKLIKSLEIDDLIVQTEDYVSPIKWHLGHTSWFFEKFILCRFKENYKPYDKTFNYIFNSYYETVSNFNLKSKRGDLSRPTVNEVLKYRKHVDDNLADFFIKNPEHTKIMEIGINHEQQHQELILMDIKNIFFKNISKPQYSKKIKVENEENIKNDFFLKEKVFYKVGYEGSDFCYDNELPCSDNSLSPFYISDFVTNKDWMEFIEDNGYQRPELWLSDGWQYIKENSIRKPMYWLKDDYVFSLNGLEKINYNLPVSHLSYYEASAYANYKNKRLPTEFELEYVLKNSKKDGNFLENNINNVISYRSLKQCKNFFGNLWAWTSSPYLPYKNFKSYESSLSEYNAKFMCNQFVLKGGSFASPINHVRSSYRNFYYPKDRWQFCGLRLADDRNNE